MYVHTSQVDSHKFPSRSASKHALSPLTLKPRSGAPTTLRLDFVVTEHQKLLQNVDPQVPIPGMERPHSTLRVSQLSPHSRICSQAILAVHTYCSWNYLSWSLGTYITLHLHPQTFPSACTPREMSRVSAVIRCVPKPSDAARIT